jgi:hypothetical protein
LVKITGSDMKTSSQIYTYLYRDTDEGANWRQQYDLPLCHIHTPAILPQREEKVKDF